MRKDKQRKSKSKLSRFLAAAVLAAGIFGSSRAKAEEPNQPEITSSVLAGGRISLSRGLSLDLLPPTLHYSGFSYEFGDEDFSMTGGGLKLQVLDFIGNIDASDPSRLGSLLDFTRRLKLNLGIDGPGRYRRDIRGSMEGFGEVYQLARAEGFRSELGIAGYAFGRGRSFIDLDLDYLGEPIPLYVDSRMSAGYDALLRSYYEAGMETERSAGNLRWGYGIAARRFMDFESRASVESSLQASILGGYSASGDVEFWRTRTSGFYFLPYLTLYSELPGIRQRVNAGLTFRHETESSRRTSDHARAETDSTSSVRTALSEEITRLRAVPRISYVAGFEEGNIFPVFSISAGEDISGRGVLGMRLDRLFLSGSLSSNLDAGSEALVLLQGSMRNSDYATYLFESESARAGFFPAWRSRMQRARSELLSSGSRLMFRSALSHDRLFSETSAENGIIYSTPQFYLDSGVRLFSAENFGGGLYNTIGTRNFFTSQAYSVSFGQTDPIIHSFLLSIGGRLP
jgi:hypothetical protein